jgi:O-acetylhomoserine/O-acetylserine sulfhydrylase
VPASHALANPNVLPASTRATLSALGVASSSDALSAPLSVSNEFVFRGVAPGSYLLDVHCATHAFAPMRVDVDVVDPDSLGASPSGGGGKEDDGRTQKNKKVLLQVTAWETFRGNDWGNKGERAAALNVLGTAFEVRCLGRKEYYMERSSCTSATSAATIRL